MLHELLATLQGCPGSIFADGNDGIQVEKGLSFLHPAEECLLNRLCILGTKYKFLYEFVKVHKLNEKDIGEIYGLYACAFTYGIDKALNPYRAAIWQLELEVLKDPCFSLTHFLQLEQYLPLFSYLVDVIKSLKIHKVHGCRILEVVYNFSSSGIPMVETCMQQILNCCHGALYRQMTAWMVYGILSDPYEEFFITPEHTEEAHLHICDTAHTSKVTRQKDMPVKPQKRYMLKPELVPSYIPSHVAAKILFVGQSVPIFDPDQNASFFKKKDPLSDFRKREKEFSSKLWDLQEKERFSLSQFIAIIDEMRMSAAEQMWKIVVEKANLLAHLKVIKEFYLLGRGELFLTFIDHAKKLLRMPVTTTAERDANDLFRLSANQTSLDDDTVAEKFYVTLQGNEKPRDVDKQSLSKAKLETGWSSIGLSYNVPWPLHILFTSSVLDRYNSVFRFLLTVRKVQIELDQCWASQMSNKGMGRESSLVIFWRLRSHMAFLIDNLQYYLQVDVLESQFSDLEHKVKTVKDFEAIQQAHDYFLTSIISQCFLHLKPVYFCLKEILDLCSSFCGLMRRVQEDTLSSSEIAQFGNIRLNFQRQTSLLFRVLSGVRSHQASPHLAQLLLRIDYNKYLSLSGGHLGGPDFSVHGK